MNYWLKTKLKHRIMKTAKLVQVMLATIVFYILIGGEYNNIDILNSKIFMRILFALAFSFGANIIFWKFTENETEDL